MSTTKNYLTDEELDELNDIVSMYLDFAELRAKQKQPMKDRIDRLDAFLEFNEQDTLTDAGRISHKVAKELAEEQYDTFHQKRLEDPTKDDFDRFLEQNRLA